MRITLTIEIHAMRPRDARALAERIEAAADSEFEELSIESGKPISMDSYMKEHKLPKATA